MALSWSWFPAEIFSKIFDRLSTVDRIRCRCVCRDWRRAAETQNFHTPVPESPWLMFSDPLKGCKLYNIAGNEEYHMDNLSEPDIRKRVWIGSSEGWLITADERSDLHLLNPITRVQIPLPSILSLPSIGAKRDPEGHLIKYLYCYDSESFVEDEAFEFSMEETKRYLFSTHGRSVVSWSQNSWLVILLFMPFQRLAYATGEDDVWTTMEGKFYRGLLFHEGVFYTLDNYEQVKVWDLTTNTSQRPCAIRTIQLDLEPDYDRFLCSYLVVSSSRILLVRRERYKGEGEDVSRTVSFEVYQLIDDGDKFRCLRMQSLEDQNALFIGNGSSISLPTQNFSNLKRNCIYFVDDNWEETPYFKDRDRDIGVCSLEDGTIAPCYPQDIPRLNWPPPVWLTPSLL